MKQPFLTINDNENLEISDMDTDSAAVEFDVNADFDGSIREFANFMFDNNISNMACSSSIHFSDEWGIETHRGYATRRRSRRRPRQRPTLLE